jgi:FKBP-type peptidyl-prolyl cis-trans isomerase
MKSSSLASIIVLALAVSACTSGGDTGSVGAPESLEERGSYALGFSAGQTLTAQGGEIDVDQLVAGLRDAFAGEEGHLTAEEIQTTMMEYQQAMAAAAEGRLAEEGAANKAAGDAFLAENADKPGVTVLDSGLQYEVLEEGDGASPLATDQVTVHYHGTLIDGRVFDSSVDRGTPATFALNGVISGWTEGVQLMKVGSKYRFFIPGELGYGPGGQGVIGPNSTLVFEVELLAINGQS